MKDDYIEEAMKWCANQKRRWTEVYKGSIKNGKGDQFAAGAASGYGWMLTHLKHIKEKGTKCDCPR